MEKANSIKDWFIYGTRILPVKKDDSLEKFRAFGQFATESGWLDSPDNIIAAGLFYVLCCLRYPNIADKEKIAALFVTSQRSLSKIESKLLKLYPIFWDQYAFCVEFCGLPHVFSSKDNSGTDWPEVIAKYFGLSEKEKSECRLSRPHFDVNLSDFCPEFGLSYLMDNPKQNSLPRFHSQSSRVASCCLI